MAAGVYWIHCRANDSYYVGESTDLERRLRQHRFDLATGRHKNRKLQGSWAKYGDEQFEFRVAWQIPFEDEASMLAEEVGRTTRHYEAVIGLAMIAEGMRLMNVAELTHWGPASPALSPLVQDIMSDRLKQRWRNPEQQKKFVDAKRRMWADQEMRQRMSTSIAKGWQSESAKVSRSGRNHWRSRSVLCVETGQRFETAAAASRFLGFRQGAISNAINRGERCGGYTWAFAD